LVGTFRIFQPGSSVATSLSEVESCIFPKHFGMIEIRDDKKFRMTPKRYSEIRPFLFRDVSLQRVDNLKAHDPNIEEKIKSYLARIVYEMIDEAKDLVTDVLSSRVAELRNHVKDPAQILIRMRVDPGSLPTINQQRFGSQFVGRVANPSEILMFSRRKQSSRSGAKGAADRLTDEDMVIVDDENDVDLGPIGDIHKIKVEELVVQSLDSGNRNLSIMPETELGSVS
jgi:double-strand break repair protein MRE11